MAIWARAARPVTTSIVKRTEPGPAAANRVAVWDFPTRLFHWLLVALIPFSWWSAEEELVEWHMWSGYAILALLLFRLMWGFVGSSTARFANFVRGPKALVGYLRDMKGWQPVGHSPLGALSVLALLGAVGAMVATGLVQSDDDGLVTGPLAGLVSYGLSDEAHDWHEDLFNVLLALIGLHIAALAFYWLVLKKWLVGAMLTGKAKLPESTEPMRPGRGWVALLCLVAAIALTGWIIAGAPPFGP